MTVRLHDLTLPELQALSRKYGGPVTYKRTELFAFLLDHFDSDNQKEKPNADQP